jgi:serine/threonine protein kinase
VSAFDEDDEATVMVPTMGPGAFFADRYRVDVLLGSGAMGRVYAASELHTGRKVALKVLHKERLGEEETVARFRREAEVLASIGHPCIVQIYAFHHDAEGTPYLAMEMLEGLTLKTRLTNGGRFENPRDFQEILDGIAGALSLAHAHGIVHRDLKPDNIFLLATGDPRAKLVDFGLSRIGNAKNKALTHSGMILGTPRYMAPEQIRNASEAGPPVDIYSLGIVTYEALSGQSPYPAQDYGQLLGCVLEARVNTLDRVRPDLPPALSAVLKRAMDADPGRRFASCDELADAYGDAIGSPSRRREITARAAAASVPIPRQRRSSLAAQSFSGANKGSTLALDLSAARDQLQGLPDLPPDPVRSYGDDYVPTAPLAQGYNPAAGYPQHQQPDPTYSSQMGGHPQAKGGDTLFLPTLGSAPPGAPPGGAPPVAVPPSARVPGTPSYGGYPGAGPQPSFAGLSPTPMPQQQRPQQAAFSSSGSNLPVQQPPPKKSRGVLVFFVAMIVVVVLSGLGGFAVKEYMRGELELPWAPPAE